MILQSSKAATTAAAVILLFHLVSVELLQLNNACSINPHTNTGMDGRLTLGIPAMRGRSGLLDAHQQL